MLYQDWIMETFGVDDFEITDVPKNGACGYSVMAMVLKHHYPDHSLVIKQYDEEDGLPRILQTKLAEYVIDNWDMPVFDDIGYDTLGNAVLDTHDVKDVFDYRYLFCNFYAGDADKIQIGEETREIKSGVRKGMASKKKIFEEIAVRWAGIPELYAFYKIFGIGLTIVHPERWVERKTKESGPTKAAINNPNTRFRCSIWFPPIEQGKESMIVWDNKIYTPHFLYCQKK